jgi:hypothetical protein
MVFAYYNRLSAAGKRIYRRSDAIETVHLGETDRRIELAAAVGRALATEARRATEDASHRLLEELTTALRIPKVQVRVLAARPSRTWGELHGLYTRDGSAAPPVVTVWMRTAMRRQVVAPRTFLRTLVHELGHHLDYELLGLEDSFHTQGFYKRESSLMHQIVSSRQAD